MTKLALTIHREGTFNLYVEGEFHCGPKAAIKHEGKRTYIPVTYAVELRCGNTLDRRGFLVDQVAIHEWLTSQGQTPTPLSCEQLVSALAYAMVSKIRRDAPNCKLTELKLHISPAPHQAYVEAHLTELDKA